MIRPIAAAVALIGLLQQFAIATGAGFTDHHIDNIGALGRAIN
jgi:hypothetical protein